VSLLASRHTSGIISRKGAHVDKRILDHHLQFSTFTDPGFWG
jgi:hypothetical protein